MTVTANTPIFSGNKQTLEWFKAVLKYHNSPALAEAEAIYQLFANAGFDVEIALGQFAAESAYGTAGYAKTTQSWGNQLYATWIKTNCPTVTAYSPGNGYTYADFTNWTNGVSCGYLPLMRSYKASGYDTLNTMTARWLGTTVGSARQQTYLNNILHAISVNEGIGATVPATYTETVQLLSGGPRLWTVAAGSTINGYDPDHPGTVVKSITFASPSSASADAEVWINWSITPAPVPKGGPFIRVIDGAFAGLLVVEASVTLTPAPPMYTQAQYDANYAAGAASVDCGTQVSDAVAATKASATVAPSVDTNTGVLSVKVTFP